MLRFYRDNARWLMAGLVLALCSSFGQTFFISLFAGHIKEIYGLTDGSWGSIYTVATLISAAVLIQAGGLADTMPLKRLTLLVLALYLAVALGMMVNRSVLILVLLIAGLRFCGQGMMSHLAVVAMARWFAARRGRAVAVAGLGTALGEAVLPSVVVFAIAWIGWRATWGVAGASLILFFLPVLFWLLATDRLPRGSVERDETAGLDGRQWNRGAVLRHWLFWALLPGLLAPSFIGTSAFFHQVHISEVRGWNLATMALGYPAYAFCAVASTLLCGWLVDRFGPVHLLPVFLLPMGVGIALIGLSDDVLSWHLMMALMGVTQGGTAAVSGTLWPYLYGTRHLGAVKALAAAAMVFATALGPGITGLAIDLGAQFPEQTVALALWCAAASVSFVVIRTRIRGSGIAEAAAVSQAASKR